MFKLKLKQVCMIKLPSIHISTFVAVKKKQGSIPIEHCAFKAYSKMALSATMVMTKEARAAYKELSPKQLLNNGQPNTMYLRALHDFTENFLSLLD